MVTDWALDCIKSDYHWYMKKAEERIGSIVDSIIEKYEFKQTKATSSFEDATSHEVWDFTCVTKLQKYYFGKTFMTFRGKSSCWQPSRWQTHKNTYDSMILLYKTNEERQALSVEDAIIRYMKGKNDPRIKNKRAGGGGRQRSPESLSDCDEFASYDLASYESFSDDDEPQTYDSSKTYIVYMCVKYDNFKDHFIDLEEKSQSLTTVAVGGNPLRQKALEALRREIDEIVRKHYSDIQYFQIRISPMSHQEFIDLQQFDTFYTLATVTEKCIPKKFKKMFQHNPKHDCPETIETLTERYASSLQQELMVYYQFYEPTDKILFTKPTNTVPGHKEYKLVVVIKYISRSTLHE